MLCSSVGLAGCALGSMDLSCCALTVTIDPVVLGVDWLEVSTKGEWCAMEEKKMAAPWV